MAATLQECIRNVQETTPEARELAISEVRPQWESINALRRDLRSISRSLHRDRRRLFSIGDFAIPVLLYGGATVIVAVKLGGLAWLMIHAALLIVAEADYHESRQVSWD